MTPFLLAGGIFACAVAGCGGATDTTTTFPEAPDPSPSGTENAPGSRPTTITEANQPGSSTEQVNPVGLQNPGTSNTGTAGRARGTGAPSTSPIDPIANGAVPCGATGRFCDSPNLTCCTPAGGAGQGANAATCQSSAAECPMGTVTIAACSGAASCDDGQVCCRTNNAPATGGAPAAGGNNGTTSRCEDSCANGSVQVCRSNEECGPGASCGNNGTCTAAACTGAANSCAAGQICCRGGGAGGGGAAVAACVAPTPAGACPNAGQRRLCSANTDCPAGSTCAPIAGGGGGGAAAALTACTAAACTPGSCAAGQLCCVGGAGATPTCSAANQGACPGNARLSCATNGDCASVAGATCSAGQNGAGALACRVPAAPPPARPPAADAGAGG